MMLLTDEEIIAVLEDTYGKADMGCAYIVNEGEKAIAQAQLYKALKEVGKWMESRGFRTPYYNHVKVILRPEELASFRQGKMPGGE
jgi:transposase